MSEGKTATLPEMPLDLIQDLATRLEQVAVRVTRRNAKGMLQTIPGWSHTLIPTLDVVNIEQLLRDQAGGGAYRIELKNPQNLAEYAVPPFFCNLEGMPKPPTPNDFSMPAPGYPSGVMQPGAMPQHGMPPMGFPTMMPAPQMQASMDAWAAGLSPAARAHYQQFQQPMQVQHEPAPGASMPSDQMALRQIGDMKAEIASLKKENANLNEKLDDERERHVIELQKQREKADKDKAELEKQLAKLVEDAREARHQASMDLMRAEMRADKAATEASARALATAPKSNGFEQYVPLIIAWLDSSSKRDLAQQSAQAQMMTTLLTQKPEKDDTLVKMMPFFLETARQKSPEAQAAVMDQLMNSQMSQLGMQAQIIQMMVESRGEGESPWAGLLQQALGGGMEMFGAFMEERKKQQAARMNAGGAPQLVQRGLPPQTFTGQQQPPAPAQQAPAAAAKPSPFPPGASYVTAQGETTSTTTAPAQSAAPKAPGARPPAPATPEQIVAMIVKAAQVPADFKTPEWQHILLVIHRRDDLPAVADVILPHLDALAQAGKLPEQLARLFDDPGQTITELLSNLPIAGYDLPYATALRDFLTQTIINIMASASAPAPVAAPAAEAASDADDAEDDGGEEEGAAEEDEADEPEPAPTNGASNGGVVDSMSLSPTRRR